MIQVKGKLEMGIGTHRARCYPLTFLAPHSHFLDNLNLKAGS